MIIKQLILKEGMECSNDVFSSKHNLIFSKTNTKGKTTYLRLLFYSLGYPIPNMKGINFERVETRIIFSEKNREYTVDRNGNLLKLTIESEKLLFTLPSEHDAFLSYVFQYNNLKVIRNLLGFLYIDQDKGWSLLNRGTVIGRIKFSIEELLAGLNNTDITPLLENKKRLEYERDKYSALLNIQELSEQVYEHHGELFISDVEKELTEKISYINLKISNLNASLKEINKEDYIFTSDLKSMSGAVLQKMVFAFKVAFLKVIEALFEAAAQTFTGALANYTSGSTIDRSICT